MAVVTSYQFDIFADYHQFYLEDEDAGTRPNPEYTAWSQGETMQQFVAMYLSKTDETAAEIDRFWLEHLAKDSDAFKAKLETWQWTEQSLADMLAVGLGILAVSTVRNFTVSVAVEIHDGEPGNVVDAWDHVVDASIDLPTGQIVLTEPTAHRPDAPRIAVHPGTYRARIFYGGLETIDEMGIEGDDHYRVVLWPGEAIAPCVLKRWAGRHVG